MILLGNTVLLNFALVGKLLFLEEFTQNKGAVTNNVLSEFEQGIIEGIFQNVERLRKPMQHITDYILDQAVTRVLDRCRNSICQDLGLYKYCQSSFLTYNL